MTVVVRAVLISALEVWRRADANFKDILGCGRLFLKKGRRALGEEAV